MQYLRTNFIFSGWICLIFGTGIVFSDFGGVLSVIGSTMSLSGLALIILGISSKQQAMSPNQIANWKPSKEDLDDPLSPNFENKKVKYRIDTTLDEPIKTSILCGKCSEITIIENSKPKSFICPKCKLQLWDEEE